MGSSHSRRRFSTDSLDAVRHNSWDAGRRSSGSSGGWDDPIWEEIVSVKVACIALYSFLIVRRFEYSTFLSRESSGAEKNCPRNDILTPLASF